MFSLLGMSAKLTPTLCVLMVMKSTVVTTFASVNSLGKFVRLLKKRLLKVMTLLKKKHLKKQLKEMKQLKKRQHETQAKLS